MISLKKALLLLLIFISTTNGSNNRLAGLLTFFHTKFTAIKNSLPIFGIPQFNFKEWFFKKPIAEQAVLPKKPIIPAEQQLDMINITEMQFSSTRQPINNDMEELSRLWEQTKVFPNQKKVLEHYTTILDKKWKELTTDFEIFLSLHSVLQRFNNLKKEYLEKPYLPQEALKKHFSVPMKKLAKKDIWLTDMLKPLDEDTKAVLRLEGITDEYLERIFLVTHTPDKEIPFEFDEYYNAPTIKGAHYFSLNSKNRIVLLNNNFLKNSLSEQLFFLNHEIAHSSQRQVERRPYEFFIKRINPPIKNFASIVNEMEADILSVLQSDIGHGIKALKLIKTFDQIYHPNLENMYPLHRYDIAVTVIKSLITGKVPREIPDSWINYAGQELKNKIHDFKEVQQNKTHSKL